MFELKGTHPGTQVRRRNGSLYSNSVTIVAKVMNFRIITPSQLVLLTEVLFHWVLTEMLCQDKFHTLSFDVFLASVHSVVFYLLPKILVDFVCFCFFSDPVVVRFSMSLVLRDSGSIEIAIPFNRLHDPQSRTEPYVTPGITYESSSHNSSVKLFLNPP